MTQAASALVLDFGGGACLFVDDQIKNVRGAIDCGFKAVHFDVARPAESYRAALAQLALRAENEPHA